MHFALLSLVATLATAQPKAVSSDGAKPVGPYSPGILTGGFLYVSGQGARDAAGKMPDGDEARVRQCLDNIKSIVTAAGLTMEHVVYAQVYLHSSTSYDVMNRVWGE